MKGLSWASCPHLVVLGLLFLCVTGQTALADQAGKGERRLAQSLFGVEQMEESYLVLRAAPVYQRPDEGANLIKTLGANSKVLVTGRISGTIWYRIATDDGQVGYMTADRLRPFGTTQSAAGANDPTRPVKGLGGNPQLANLTGDLQAGSFRDCPQCPQMVVLPKGSFTMGARKGHLSEQPQHKVAIDHFVAVGRFEVTQAEWLACVADGACSRLSKPADEPEGTAVRNVSWVQAQAYVSWLRQITGKPYRLLSEAEWEYAARAGSETAYWWGDVPEGAMADCQDCGGDWNRGQPVGIGRFKANPFGLHDMNGGVAEWTADCWFDDYKTASGSAAARDRKNCQRRVLRGGSWRQKAEHLRSSARHFYDPSVAYGSNGFRVGLTIE